MNDTNRVSIARIMRPQGRRGELLAQPLTDLQGVFAPGAEVVLEAEAITGRPSRPSRTAVLEDRWLPTGKNAGRIVLKLSGCESINEAELLAGYEITVSRSALPALDADTFYVGDLVGCVLIDGDARVGTITGVDFPMSPDGRSRLADAAPLLAVSVAETPEAEPVLVPFVRAWLVAVDIAAKEVRMSLPAGLIDVAQAEVE